MTTRPKPATHQDRDRTRREAAALGVTIRQYRYLRDTDRLIRREDGDLDVEATQRAILESSALPGDRGRPSEAAMQAAAATSAIADMPAARLRQVQIAIEIAEMRRDEMRRALVSREEVQTAIESILVGLRERLLAVPARVVGAYAAAGEGADIGLIVDREVRAALEDAARALEGLAGE